MGGGIVTGGGGRGEMKAWKNGCLVEMGGGMEGRVWADWLEGREVIFTLVASRFVLMLVVSGCWFLLWML